MTAADCTLSQWINISQLQHVTRVTRQSVTHRRKPPKSSVVRLLAAPSLGMYSCYVCFICTQDRTVLSCLDSTQFRWVLSRLDPVFNFHLFSNRQYIWDWTVANWKLSQGKTKLNETGQNCPVLSPIVFTRPTRTRQDKTVLSRPCRRCEQAITVGYHRQRVSTVLKHLSSVICGSTAWKQAENEQNKYT